jgi:hypothetical protein
MGAAERRDCLRVPLPRPVEGQQPAGQFTLPCNVRPAFAKGKAMLKEADKLHSYNEGDLTPGSTPLRTQPPAAGGYKLADLAVRASLAG